MLHTNLLQWQAANVEMENSVIEMQRKNGELAALSDLEMHYLESCDQVNQLKARVEDLNARNNAFNECELKMLALEKTVLDLNTQHKRDVKVLILFQLIRLHVDSIPLLVFAKK